MKKAGAMAVFFAAMLAAAPAVRAAAPTPSPVGARVDAESSELDETADLLAWDSEEDDDDDMMLGDEDEGGPGPGEHGPMAGGPPMGGRHMGPGGMHGGMGPGGPRGMRGGPGKRSGMGMRHGGPGMHGGMMHARLAQLDLSTSQRERLTTIREGQARTAIQMRADLQLARLDMAKLMRAQNPDQSALNAQIDRMARLRADAAKTRLSGHLEMRSVLTAEQIKKMHERGPMMERNDGKPGAKKSAASKTGEMLHR